MRERGENNKRRGREREGIGVEKKFELVRGKGQWRGEKKIYV